MLNTAELHNKTAQQDQSKLIITVPSSEHYKPQNQGLREKKKEHLAVRLGVHLTET